MMTWKQLNWGRNDTKCAAVRMLLGSVLLIAAALKTYQLTTSPPLGDSLISSRWFQLLAIEIEMAGGIWLIVGIAERWAMTVAAACFAVFALITFSQGISGQEACGCFGPARVHPWLAFSLDIAAVSSLSLCLLGERAKQTLTESIAPALHTRLVIGVAIWFSLGGGAAIAIVGFSVTRLSELGQVMEQGNAVLLAPQAWEGKQFPLLAYVDKGDLLKSGQWSVVLYRHGCGHCEQTLTALRDAPRSLQEATSYRAIMVLQLPPYHDRDGNLDPTLIVFAKLSDQYEWFVKTPVVFTLDNGKVVQVRTEIGEGAGEALPTQG